ncbi:hypothetical protein M8J77_000608 [Diaphorina citri]|nr:hypothetical protein M8J77_000608 [Diaphorina citri]
MKEEEALCYQLPNFIQMNKCRVKRRGGGVMLFYKQCLQIENDAKGDMKKTWSLINDLMDKKIKEPIELKLQRNFQTKDTKLLANNFNKNFLEQIKKIKETNKGPKMDVKMTEFEPHSNYSSMYLRRVDEKDVRNILSKMKKSGKGVDGIRNADIIQNTLLFTPLITHLVNLMIDQNKIPNNLKISCITPLFKKGQPNELGNYRPVGSMPLIEKIIEKHINNQTNKYLKENQILPELQHGFQSEKSTITLLQEFSNSINSALDRRKCIVILFLDLSLAFDTTDHDILLKKFLEVGIIQKRAETGSQQESSHSVRSSSTNNPMDFSKCYQPNILTDYFNNRRQLTRIGTTTSEVEMVKQGLVQGAINSPCWFNVYTYDVKYLKIKTMLKMFADDSCLISIHSSLETAVKNIQEDFINLQKYFYNNHIYLNAKKTEAMALGFQSKRVDMSTYKIICHSRQCLADKTYETNSCSCHPIEYKDQVRYLGVIIDNEIMMKPHVFTLSKKMRTINYKLNKIRADMFPLTTKKTIYFSLIDSILRYGVSIYTYAPQYVINPLKKMQRRIVKLLFNGCEQNVQMLDIDQLSKFVLLTLNFKNNKYRQVNDQHHSLRLQKFQRPRVYTITYGERMLEYAIPTLLHNYCQEFLDEEKKDVIKSKIKKSLLRDSNSIL